MVVEQGKKTTQKQEHPTGMWFALSLYTITVMGKPCITWERLKTPPTHGPKIWPTRASP